MKNGCIPGEFYGRNIGKNCVDPGEHDWMSECMKLQQPGRVLLEHQIDYEVVSIDMFEQCDYYGTEIKNGELIINGIHMSALIVPETDFLDARLASVIEDAAESGLKVIFINRMPERVIGTVIKKESLKSAMSACDVVPLEELSVYLEDREIYCMFNTSLSKTINNKVVLEEKGQVVRYDAMKNCIYPVEQTETKIGIEIPLNLEPYESIVLLVLNDANELPLRTEENCICSEAADISEDWLVSKVKSIEYPQFQPLQKIQRLEPVSRRSPKFSGVMRYEKKFEVKDGSKVVFAPQYVYEAAEVYVNGISAGKKLTPPYRWDISELCHEGENHLAVEVVNTPTRDTLKTFSPFGPEREILEPSGMFGKIELRTKE